MIGHEFRNAYLDGQQRNQALVLHRSLMRVRMLWESGNALPKKLMAADGKKLRGEESVRLDYFEIVDADSLEPVEKVKSGTVAAVAAFVGTTRLIDNILL